MLWHLYIYPVFTYAELLLVFSQFSRLFLCKYLQIQVTVISSKIANLNLYFYQQSRSGKDYLVYLLCVCIHVCWYTCVLHTCMCVRAYVCVWLSYGQRLSIREEYEQTLDTKANLLLFHLTCSQARKTKFQLDSLQEALRWQ